VLPVPRCPCRDRISVPVVFQTRDLVPTAPQPVWLQALSPFSPALLPVTAQNPVRLDHLGRSGHRYHHLYPGLALDGTSLVAGVFCGHGPTVE